jgi:hypothetical protein
LSSVDAVDGKADTAPPAIAEAIWLSVVAIYAIAVPFVSGLQRRLPRRVIKIESNQPLGFDSARRPFGKVVRCARTSLCLIDLAPAKATGSGERIERILE